MRRFGQLILNLDRRIIYGLVFLFVLVPLVWPIGLPIKPTGVVQTIYDDLETLAPGSVVIVSADYGPGAMAETDPMLRAVLYHCFSRGLKPVVLALVVGGDTLGRTAIRDVLATQKDGAPLFPDKVKGRDYAYLGYKAGSSAVILGLTQSFTAAFPVDGDGDGLASQPIFNKVRKLADVDYIISAASVAMPEAWLTFGSVPAKVPMAVNCTAVSAAQYYPYVNTGQFRGLAGGMKGAAEYEVLVDVAGMSGKVPDATKAMDAQSLVHVFIVLAVVLANFFYLLEGRHKRLEVGA
jgi:hypothetical protein